MLNFLSNPVKIPILNLFLTKRLFLISIEYKAFVYNKLLYILLGDANYLLVPLPSDSSFFFFCRKKKLYIWTDLLLNAQLFFLFFNVIVNLKKLNIYKGKGLILSKNFNLIRLKKGKKQQFM